MNSSSDTSVVPQELFQHIALQVRTGRQQKNWSQQALAKQSGVSRRMIAMLEQGESNVSLATLYKISMALGITFGQLLMGKDSESLAVIEAHQMPVLWRQGQSNARLVLSVRTKQAAEVWHWELAPGGRYPAEPDPEGVEELIYVLSGMLTLDLNGTLYELEAGEAIRFSSQSPFFYTNTTDTPVTFIENVLS
jgi:transcriptional regulator with XRE-family HTH domain